MTQAKPKIRLFVPAAYQEEQDITLEKPQSHYLLHVMRAKLGDVISVFNGKDGVWLAEITHADKKHAALTLKSQLLAHISSPDLWLAFAPIKNKTELVVEKATELGVSHIFPVFTKHSVVTKVNMDKLSARSIEAAEQCERHDVPAIDEGKNLSALLAGWPEDRTLLFADEGGGGEALGNLPAGKYGVLIGPEGGFSREEQEMLRQSKKVKPFGMGPRILRADTAAVAALSCVMAQCGDWQHKPHFEAKA